ncbi:MAG: hypothetical protein LBQ12_00185, partial [Deltaproteobacteria bacterium]|nr:hypothetical protein [Deltaproteobacteria bacterium]
MIFKPLTLFAALLAVLAPSGALVAQGSSYSGGFRGYSANEVVVYELDTSSSPSVADKADEKGGSAPSAGDRSQSRGLAAASQQGSSPPAPSSVPVASPGGLKAAPGQSGASADAGAYATAIGFAPAAHDAAGNSAGARAVTVRQASVRGAAGEGGAASAVPPVADADSPVQSGRPGSGMDGAAPDGSNAPAATQILVPASAAADALSAPGAQAARSVPISPPFRGYGSRTPEVVTYELKLTDADSSPVAPASLTASAAPGPGQTSAGDSLPSAPGAIPAIPPGPESPAAPAAPVAPPAPAPGSSADAVPGEASAPASAKAAEPASAPSSDSVPGPADGPGSAPSEAPASVSGGEHPSGSAPAAAPVLAPSPGPGSASDVPDTAPVSGKVEQPGLSPAK